MSVPKKRRVSESSDPDIWLRWLEEMSSGEESPIDEDEEDEEKEYEDIVEKSDHETDSELEVASEGNERSSENTDSEQTNDNFYVGKDKITRWKKSCGNLQVRVRAHNIIKYLPGPKVEARNALSAIDCIKPFMFDDVIKIIVGSTNVYIENVKHKFLRERDSRFTNETEIRALIGILFLIGTLRCSRRNAHKIWDNSKGSGVESCYLAMSEKRLRFLIRCLRFDDVTTRKERKELDKLAPIREVFEICLANFQRSLIASEYVTVDEQLLDFRGRCSFKQ